MMHGWTMAARERGMAMTLCGGAERARGSATAGEMAGGGWGREVGQATSFAVECVYSLIKGREITKFPSLILIKFLKFPFKSTHKY